MLKHMEHIDSPEAHRWDAVHVNTLINPITNRAVIRKVQTQHKHNQTHPAVCVSYFNDINFYIAATNAASFSSSPSETNPTSQSSDKWLANPNRFIRAFHKKSCLKHITDCTNTHWKIRLIFLAPLPPFQAFCQDVKVI